jgi:hypothetical protein
LLLKRSPRFLRVTEEAGTFDALDQFNDSPRPRERLHAYELASEVGTVHINRGGGRGGFYPLASYRLVTEQPSDAEMRDYAAWCRWCHDHDPKR